MLVSRSGVSGISALHFHFWNHTFRMSMPGKEFLDLRIWHIENSRASLWNPKYSEKGDLPEHFARTFSLVMRFSNESERVELMTLLNMNLPLAVFYRYSLSHEVIDKPKADLNSSNSNYFPLCPPETRHTPWTSSGPRWCAPPSGRSLGRAFQSICNRLHYEMCRAVSRRGLF